MSSIEFEQSGDGRNVDASGMLRFYDLAKKAEWQIDDLSWGECPPVPEPKPHWSDKKAAIFGDIWKSVLAQQLQADSLAVVMASQLFNAAEHPEAKQYYATMVQDEARHTEVWLKLVKEAGSDEEGNPYLDKLVGIVLDADTIEEKIFLMQVFFERLIIPKFRQIERKSAGTVLAETCQRLAIDDGIHHMSGVTYEKALLADAPNSLKAKVGKTALAALKPFKQHALWRPTARAAVALAMDDKDKKRLIADLEWGIDMAWKLGIDVRDADLSLAAD